MADATAAGEHSTQQTVKWTDKGWVQILLFAAGLITYVLIGIILWWLLDKYIEPKESSQKRTSSKHLA
jgi:F0F1-type ATP synthase assembly protein I